MERADRLTLRSNRLGLRTSNRLSFGEGSGYFFIAAVMLTKIQILHILFSDASDEASWEIRSFVPRPTPPKGAFFIPPKRGATQLPLLVEYAERDSFAFSL